MRKKSTILDVAREANVSVATVSRVVNNQGGVKKETEERILRAIKNLNYIRNAIARSMVRKETKTIGVIIPDITNPFFSQVISGIERIALENNYFTILSSSNESERIESEILQHYLERGVDGLIITTANESGRQLEPFINSGIPIVAVDRQIKQFDVDTVLTGNREGAYEAISHLILNGHKKIAIIRGPQNTTPGLERYKGYVKALEENGISIQDEYVGDGNFMEESGYELTKQFYQLADRPTAIFSCNNLMSIGSVKAINDLNWQIGKDLAFTGFDDIEIATFISPNLTMISRSMRHLGEIAFKLLRDRMNGSTKDEPFKKKQYIISPSLIIRESCRRL